MAISPLAARTPVTWTVSLVWVGRPSQSSALAAAEADVARPSAAASAICAAALAYFMVMDEPLDVSNAQ
jgi:hypothetical protein